MYGHDSAPSRIYSYGAKPPVELDLVDAQMRAAHRYRNQLVEIERARRAAVDASLAALSPRLAAVEAEIVAAEVALEAAIKALTEAQARARSKVRPTALTEPVAALRAALKALRAERKALRTDLFASASWAAAQARTDEPDGAARKAARAESGLYWGTYLAVEQAMGGARHGAPPRFAPWKGDGRLAVQLQHGLPVADLHACTDTRLQVEPVPDEAWLPGGRRLRKTTVRFRVGSTDSGAPVWATVPIVLHRPLPADTAVKWAYLIRRRIATHCEWRVQLVLARAAGWSRPDQAHEGAVGIDVGWRLRPPDGGLRVAYWVGSDGADGELRLPARWLVQMRKVEEIRSIRDQNFDAARAALAAAIKASRGQPEWFAEAVATLASWKAPARLAALVIRWRSARFNGDAQAYAAAEAWRARDKHLYEYEANLRDQLQRERFDRYRVFAATLRRRYRTARVETLDLRAFHVLPASEALARDGALTEHLRDACLSALRQCLRESMREFAEVPAADTTTICAACGSREQWDRSVLSHTCSRCAQRYDQDRNAALNILRAGEPAPEGAGR